VIDDPDARDLEEKELRVVSNEGGDKELEYWCSLEKARYPPRWDIVQGNGSDFYLEGH